MPILHTITLLSERLGKALLPKYFLRDGIAYSIATMTNAKWLADGASGTSKLRAFIPHHHLTGGGHAFVRDFENTLEHTNHGVASAPDGSLDKAKVFGRSVGSPMLRRAWSPRAARFMAVDNLTLDYDTGATSWYSEMCVVAGAVTSIVSFRRSRKHRVVKSCLQVNSDSTKSSAEEENATCISLRYRVLGDDMQVAYPFAGWSHA